MKDNKRPIKVSDEFYNFLKKLGTNRIRVGIVDEVENLCNLPDIIVKYFKVNNDRYLELCNMEAENGTK